MNHLRKIIYCAFEDYVQWLMNTRQILLIVLLMFNYTLAVQPLKERVDLMDERVSILEPFIAVGSSGMILLIMPIVFLILISDFPYSKGNVLFRISRIGRKCWLIAQLLELLMMILTFLFITALGAILPLLGRFTISGKWSRIVTHFAVLFPERAGSYELLSENLYNQIHSASLAAFHTYALLSLYLFLIGNILLCMTLIQHRKVGNAVTGFLIAGGAALCSMKSQLMWLLPMAHSIPWVHYTRYLRRPIVPIGASYLYLGLTTLVLLIVEWITVHRFAFNSEEM